MCGVGGSICSLVLWYCSIDNVSIVVVLVLIGVILIAILVYWYWCSTVCLLCMRITICVLRMCIIVYVLLYVCWIIVRVILNVW